MRIGMLGLLTYPTRWFWDGTRTELLQSGLLGERRTREPQVVLRDHIRGTSFIAFEDGYVAMDSEDRALVTRSFNAFFLGLTLLTGHFAEPATEKVLERVELNPDDTRTVREQPVIVAANFLGAHPQLRHGDSRCLPPFPGLEDRHDACGTDEIGVVLQFAGKILRGKRPPLAVRILEQQNQAADGNLTASLILGWIMVEQVIDAELVRLLVGPGMSRTQAREKVYNMSEKAVIRRLRQNKPTRTGSNDPTLMTRGLLQEFDRLRVIRNEVVHGERDATRADVERVKKAVERAMWRAMRQKGIGYQAFLERIAILQKGRQDRLRR